MMAMVSRILSVIMIVSLTAVFLMPAPVAADELTRKERKFVEDMNSMISFIWDELTPLTYSIGNIDWRHEGTAVCRNDVLQNIDPDYQEFMKAAEVLDGVIVMPDTFSAFESNLEEMRSGAKTVGAKVYWFSSYMYDVVCPSLDTDSPLEFSREQWETQSAISKYFGILRSAQDKLASISAELTEERGGVSKGNVVQRFVDDIVGGIIPDTSCFIATAAYGTESAEEITVLREFRDEYLMESSAGELLVKTYYRVSPPVAEVISQVGLFRVMTRELFIDPLVDVIELTEPLWN
jgi:hypothetical protein